MNRKYDDLNKYEKQLVNAHWHNVRAISVICKKKCSDIKSFFENHKETDFEICPVCDNIKHTDGSQCKFCVKFGL